MIIFKLIKMDDNYQIWRLFRLGCLSKECSKFISLIIMLFSIIFSLSLSAYAFLTSLLSTDFRNDQFYGIQGTTNTYNSAEFTRLILFLATAAIAIFITSLVMIVYICRSNKQSKPKAKVVMGLLLVILGFTLVCSAVLGGIFLSYHSRWSSFFNHAFFNANSSTKFMDMVRICTYYALVDFALGSSVVLPMVGALAYYFLKAISEVAGQASLGGNAKDDSFQMIQTDA